MTKWICNACCCGFQRPLTVMEYIRAHVCAHVHYPSTCHVQYLHVHMHVIIFVKGASSEYCAVWLDLSLWSLLHVGTCMSILDVHVHCTCRWLKASRAKLVFPYKYKFSMTMDKVWYYLTWWYKLFVESAALLWCKCTMYMCSVHVYSIHVYVPCISSTCTCTCTCIH